MRSAIVGLMAGVALFFVIAGCTGEKVENQPDAESSLDLMPNRSVDEVSKLYDVINHVPLSELKDDIAKIIEERIACYNETPIASMRTSECRKAYNLKLLTLLHQKINAKPMLGESVLCFQYCPIFHALCRGNDLGGDPENCVLQEARCIEYCLDKYWRGTSFSWDEPGR